MTDACGFNFAHFAATLRAAHNAGYVMPFAREFAADPEVFDRILVLRHDVDYSLEYAVALARLEADLGVRSTFFVRLHSRFYDPTQPKQTKFVRQIAELGFEIGLHYEYATLGTDGGRGAALARERNLLAALAETEICGASEHMPAFHGRDVAGGGRHITDEELVEGGFAYEAHGALFSEQLRYLSDSNQRWRTGCLHEAIGVNPMLYCLIHPVWWVENAPEPPLLIERLRSGD